ncbi:N-acetylmuramic acid 6-phosphate etherase [Lactovum odontotermitis]
MINLEKLTTERRNTHSLELDAMTLSEQLTAMNAEDQKVALAIQGILPEIKAVIEKVIDSFNKGGRLLYLGAGTSGRLGVLDAAECVPTFGVSAAMVVGLIAGGESAMINAVEGAEDSTSLGVSDLKGQALTENDTVIGIAASGRTPYVIGALDYAREIGAATVAFSCNTNAEMSQHAELKIEVDCGPEFVTGSTRLKSGTAQKLVLNMISTLSMVGIGKVYNNLMVDLKPTNEKLVERSKRIIMQATDCDYKRAAEVFEESGRHVKTAIVMILTDSSKDEAAKKLEKSRGFVKNAVNNKQKEE